MRKIEICLRLRGGKVCTFVYFLSLLELAFYFFVENFNLLVLLVKDFPLKMFSKLGNVDFWVQKFSKKAVQKVTPFYEFSGTQNASLFGRPLYDAVCISVSNGLIVTKNKVTSMLVIDVGR